MMRIKRSVCALCALLALLLSSCDGNTQTAVLTERDIASDETVSPEIGAASLPSVTPAAAADMIPLDWESGAARREPFRNETLPALDDTSVGRILHKSEQDELTQVYYLPAGAEASDWRVYGYLETKSGRFDLGLLSDHRAPGDYESDLRDVALDWELVASGERLYAMFRYEDQKPMYAVYRLTDGIPLLLCEFENLLWCERDGESYPRALVSNEEADCTLIRLDVLRSELLFLPLNTLFNCETVQYEWNGLYKAVKMRTNTVNVNNADFRLIGNEFINAGYISQLPEPEAPDLSGFIPPPLLPEYTPELVYTVSGFYEGDENDRVWIPTLEDADGNRLPLPAGTAFIFKDNQWPVDSGSLVSLTLPKWAMDKYENYDHELGYSVNQRELGCYVLEADGKLAVMRLDGELVTDFNYDGYDIYDIYGPWLYAYKGYLCIRGLYDHRTNPRPDETHYYTYCLIDIRTGSEVLPQVYVQLDMYDGYIYAADDQGGHFIFDYEGNVLADLSEYHDWLKDKSFPLDILLKNRGH